MRIKRFVASSLLAGSLLVAFAGGVGAAAKPNPGDRNCRGVVVSNTATTEGGLGKAAREEGFTVRERQQENRDFCDMIQGEQPN